MLTIGRGSDQEMLSLGLILVLALNKRLYRARRSNSKSGSLCPSLSTLTSKYRGDQKAIFAVQRSTKIWRPHQRIHSGRKKITSRGSCPPLTPYAIFTPNMAPAAPRHLGLCTHTALPTSPDSKVNLHSKWL